MDDDIPLSDREKPAGVIEGLHLKNFMCHENYQVDFGPRINIILGRNGSGKSSILAGIQIALGGKTSCSGKAVVLKNTVQRGKPCAELSIRLRNSGPDAFRAEVYGDKIIVDRRISADGASSYKLKNSHGHIISTKKEDLVAILETFNIQVGNPVAILTQEMSKVFLSSGGAQEKYKLFLQATQLEQLENMYRACEEQAVFVKRILEAKEMNLGSLREEIQALEKEKRLCESQEHYKDQLAELYKELIWADVIAKEELLEELSQHITEQESTLQKLSVAVSKAEKQYADVLDQKNNLAQRYQILNQEIHALLEQSKELMRQSTELENNRRVKQSRLNALGRNIVRKEKEVEAAKVRAAEASLCCQEVLAKEKQAREEQISVCRKRQEGYQRNLASLQQQLEHSKMELHEKSKEYTKISEELKLLKQCCSEVEKHIDKLEKIKYNRMIGYGSRMPRLQGYVDEAFKSGRFKKKPLGPLGLYVDVKDRKWSIAIEVCLGVNLLKSFLCDNVHDRDVLTDIMMELYQNAVTPQIITSPFTEAVYDVSSTRVYSESFPCILDVIDVQEPAVLNCLIDQKGIENVLLIPLAETAREIMSKEDKIPPRCNAAYTTKGNEVYPYPKYRFYKSRKRAATLISSNVDEVKNAKEQELKDLREQYHRLDAVVKDKATEQRSLESSVKNMETQINLCNNYIDKENAEISILEETDIPDGTSAVDAELEVLSNTLTKLVEERETVDQELTIMKQRYDDCQTEIESKKAESSVKKKEVDNIVRQQRENNLRVSRALQKRHDVVHQFETSEAYLNEYKKAYEQSLCVKNEKLQTALDHCPRIVTTRKCEVISASIEEVKSLIAEAEKRYPNFEATMTTLMNLRAKHEKTMDEINWLVQKTEKLESMMQVRLEAFKNIRFHTCMRVNYHFTSSLIALSFNTRLMFDHEKKTIDIKAKDGDYGGFTKTLSGGERSFVTVALLLALWTAAELPFRIMDEYDVYMDQLNRKRSMDLMLRVAEENQRNQFIFLTPQLLPKTKITENIKILKLDDPKRNDSSKRKKRRI